MTKGGYKGIRKKRGDDCPICGNPYDFYIPADSDRSKFGKSVRQVCVSVNNAAFASGAYVHFGAKDSLNDRISQALEH